MSEILWMTPVFKEMIWGGDRLRTGFQYDIPSDRTGECWAISAHPNGDCRIASGTYEGSTLSQIWEQHPELFGQEQGDRFPLLIKIIDAKKDLSIQVHPDDAYAKVQEHGSLGKTECWYVLDCDKDAQIVIGHHAKDHEELERMIRREKWDEFVRIIPIQKGDFFQIDPGCLHAIKGGTMILETQQNSDITYRVYDYGRLENGNPRLLHVEQSIDTIHAPFVEERNQITIEALDGAAHTHFITCPYYCVDKYDVDGTFIQEFTSSFTNVSIIEGEGSIDGSPIRKGDHFIIPNAYGCCEFKGAFSMICSNPGGIR